MPKKLLFFDCNAYLGLPVDRLVQPIFSTAEFLAAMRRDGVGRALVWHVAQYEYSPKAGNRMLEEEIAAHENLFGCWAILPEASMELPRADELLARMKRSRIVALRAFPSAHEFFLDRLSCGRLLDAAVERRIPLLLSMGKGTDYGTVHGVLKEYPNLVCILCDHKALDRQVLVLLDHYPNVYLDMTRYALRGMIETTCRRFGADRILFSSGFPESSFAAAIYEVEHAQVSEADRAAIAGGNLQRILAQVQL